jgi:hypothetical protein
MAAITATIQIKGLRELDAILSTLPDAVEEWITFDALTASGALIRKAAQDNINSRTGRTAADIRAEVQVMPTQHQGVVAVGGTRMGRTGRAHVLRWLEFGTKSKPGKILAGASGRREGRRAVRALRAIGRGELAAALRRGLREGSVTVKRAMTLPGGLLRASVKHRGISAQSPLTRALLDHADAALKMYKDTMWRGIVKFTATRRRAA